MGSARTEATKRRKERSRARKAAKALKDLRNGEPAHPRSYATRASTRSWIEAKNSDFEPSGSGDRNSYPASVVRLHRKHWIKDREHSFDLPIRSRTLPTVTPQLERSSLVTLKGYEQRGQPDDLNHGLFGFSSGQSSHSQVTSESFSPLDEMPKSMFQPAKSRSAQHSRGPAWVGENNQMIDPLQTTSGAIDTLLTHGEEGGGVSLADHRSYDPCGPSSGCHKSPGVLGPKIQQREGGERLSAKSLPDMQGGGIRADMVRDSERLFQESSYGIAGRLSSIGRGNGRTNSLNAISKRVGKPESGPRKRALGVDVELSLLCGAVSLNSTMHPAHGIGSKANKKPRRQRLGSSPRLEGGVTLYADSDWQTSPARLAESGLRTGDVAEYPIHKNQPHLRSDNVKRPASPAKNKASTIPAPQPTEAYLLQANQPTLELHRPRDILLILDLNGTLLHRMNRSKSQHFVARPHTREFLQHLLSRFSVMIWSSATPTSVTAMCRKLFSKEQRGLLVAEWARDKLGLTPQQYNQKVQVYKQLERVWDSDAIATSHPQHSAGGRWDQTNTILLDDSALKASAQPYNHISVPEFKGVRESESEKSVFNQVVGYLEAITLQRDVSSFIRKDPFEVADGWNAVDPSG